MDPSADVELATRIPLPQSSSTVVTSLNGDEGDVPEASLRNESSLAPVDEGFGAWSYLAGTFIVETIVWGFPDAYGSFLNEYLLDPTYSSQPSATAVLPLIGPLSSGMMYFSGFIIYPLIARYPSIRRWMMWTGVVISFLSLFTATYTTKVYKMVILQGCVYGLGGSFLYAPTISYMSEWFVNRRGLANGIMFAGTAAGGLLVPLVVPRLIAAYGPAKALRIISIIFTSVTILGLPFIKGRLPESRISGPRVRSRDRSWIHDKTIWFLLAANTFHGFGYFVPLVWLPTFATSLGLSSNNASLVLALLNGASVVGRIGFGFLSDKTDPWLLATVTLTMASLSTFVLWGVLSISFPGLLAFGIFYGCIAGGWTCLWTSFIRPIAKDNLTLSTSLFGYLLVSRGLGNVLSTPISALLSSSRVSRPSGVYRVKTGFDVGGGRFETMIVYVGACFACAALIVGTNWTMTQLKGRL